MKPKHLILVQIKKTVLDLEPDAHILLFGSQARGDADEESDYDLLVITSKQYSSTERVKAAARLNRSLVKDIGLPVDVLLTTYAKFEEKKTLPGHIFRTIAREGILI